MKTSRFTDSQIIAVLKEAAAGTPVPQLCRTNGISNATFYTWRSKFGGMNTAPTSPACTVMTHEGRVGQTRCPSGMSNPLDALREVASGKGVARR